MMTNFVKSLQISFVWFTNITLFTTGDIAWVSVLKTNNSEQHENFLTKVTVIIHVLIQFYMSAIDIR